MIEPFVAFAKLRYIFESLFVVVVLAKVGAIA
jgi:hypothetical protein